MILRLQPYGSVMPTTLTYAKEFKQTLEKVDLKIMEMKLDEEITGFMQKLTIGHATLADLTESVETWSVDNSFENKIRLSL